MFWGSVFSIMLVGGFSHLEKYEFVSGKDDIHVYIYNYNIYIYVYHILWTIKTMFETTIQNMTWISTWISTGASPMAPWPHGPTTTSRDKTTNGEATMGMGSHHLEFA